MFQKTICTLALTCLSINGVWATEQSSAETLAAKWVITVSDDYRLEDTITRKEMMKIVMNLSWWDVPDLCSGIFPDVVNDWGCKYIEEALYQDFIAPNETFRPNDTITKAESMKLVLKSRAIEKSQNTNDWQADYMETAYTNGLISEKYSDHNDQATRGWIFSVSAKEKTSKSSAEIQNSNMQKLSAAPTEPSQQIGVYTDYSASLIWASDTTVLFFHASWCPSCKAADTSLSGADVVSSGITLLKTDYDTETELRKKYGVTTQHTFVQIDANGDLITKWSGWNSLADIQEKIM